MLKVTARKEVVLPGEEVSLQLYDAIHGYIDRLSLLCVISSVFSAAMIQCFPFIDQYLKKKI